MSDSISGLKSLPPAATATILTRLAFGPNVRDRAVLSQLGLRGWLDAQLAPREAEDTDAHGAIAACRLRVKYDANEKWPAMDEERPLSTLDRRAELLWPLGDGKQPLAGPERQLPRLEVAAAALLRAVHSRWPLREVMVDFWHNHFNVNAGEQQVAATLPVYDREVIRTHAFGNFRTFLEAVADSAAMLVYLNNRSSRAGIANENYARELFELHTLGRGAYLNALYNRWRDVPGAVGGKPAGYIDQDVYEAARAFTGWTVADGAGLGGDTRLPVTGAFTYVENWHDNYQKRVLGQEFDAFQGPMSDGRRVLDLVADHPATARFVVDKLCRRLVADHPPAGLIERAAAVWTEYRRAPDQIARVVRAIVLAPEFLKIQAGKVKRPFELVASFARAAVPGFTVTLPLLHQLDASGQRLFGWPAPTGHPDTMADWLGAAAMRQRWALVLGLAENQWKTGDVDLTVVAPPGGTVTAGDAVAAWQTAMLGPLPDMPPDTPMIAAILAGMKLGREHRLIAGQRDDSRQLRRMAAYLAMSPLFNRR